MTELEFQSMYSEDIKGNSIVLMFLFWGAQKKNQLSNCLEGFDYHMKNFQRKIIQI